MNDPSDWFRRPAAPRRNNFFFGKMMGVAQFEQEQRYGLGQRWLINRLTLGTGILCGLDVEATSDGRRIRIAPGVAVDPWGREIVVSRQVEYDPSASGGGCGCSDEPAITQPGVYTLVLRYGECHSNALRVSDNQDCPGQADCQPDTTVETFLLLMRSSPPPTQPFDCAAWMAPVSAAALNSAVLRKRLANQFRGAYGPLTDDPCVPLALVTVTVPTPPDGIRVSVSDDPRVHIHSQAQMLDAILCLAKTVAECCGTPNTVQPQPPIDDMPTVTELAFLRLEAGQLVTVAPRAGTSPPVFDAKETAAGSGQWDSIHLRISFSSAIDGANIISPPNQPRGFEVTVAPLGGGGTAATGATAVLENANVVLITCPGDPGGYVLTLRGDPAGLNQTPIVSWDLDPAKRKRLDGEFRGQFPSGDQNEGGDFVYAFEIRGAAPPNTFRIVRIEFLSGANPIAELTTRTGTKFQPARRVNAFRVVFNADVNLRTASRRGAVTVTRAGNPVNGSVEAVSGDTKAFEYRLTRNATGTPEQGEYEVRLSGEIITDVPPPGAHARLLDGNPQPQDPPVPSGDGHERGDFIFRFTIGD